MSKSSLGALNTDKGWRERGPPGISWMGLTAVLLFERKGEERERETDRQESWKCKEGV